jgi:hypothetical protein
MYPFRVHSTNETSTICVGLIHCNVPIVGCDAFAPVAGLAARQFMKGQRRDRNGPDTLEHGPICAVLIDRPLAASDTTQSFY